MDFKTIWKTLSAIDCTKHTKKVKAGYAELTYLPWSSAWELICNNYPDSTFKVLEDKAYGETLEVWVELTIGGNSRTMWLPVMDNRNNSIKNPTSREVSDNRMRCLVKAAAMFGLGLYIYQGEELPKPSQEVEEHKKKLRDLVMNGDGIGMLEFSKTLTDQQFADVYNSFPPGKKVSGKKAVDDLVNAGWEIVNKYANELADARANEDEPYETQLIDEVSPLIFDLIERKIGV